MNGKNTAKITDPIWDSRNSDEPEIVETPQKSTWCEHIIVFCNEWVLQSQPPCSAKKWNYCPMCGSKRP